MQQSRTAIPVTRFDVGQDRPHARRLAAAHRPKIAKMLGVSAATIYRHLERKAA
jgi:hypothetical protein